MADDSTYEILLRTHAKNVRHTGLPEPVSGAGTGENPRCGDWIEVGVSIESGRITRIGYQANACGLCKASASMLCEAVEGRMAEEVIVWSAEAAPETVAAAWWNCVAWAVCSYPQRRRCVELPWSAMQNALRDWQNRNKVCV